MEPIARPLTFGARVIKVQEVHERKWMGGWGDDARFMEISKGWFITLDGSHESFFAGMDKPNIKVGYYAHIRIDFTKEL